jgi:hypothetical protein
MNDAAYRSSNPQAFTDTEYTKLASDYHALKSTLRQRARDVFWYGTGMGALLVVVAILGFVLYWCCYRGTAWGGA